MDKGKATAKLQRQKTVFADPADLDLLGAITPINTKKSGAQTSRGGGETTLNQFSDIVSKTHQQ